MSQDQLSFHKNSEHESEFESEYDESGSDTKFEDSEGDSDYENIPKRRRMDDGPETEEELLTDKNGHILWHSGQRLGVYEIRSALGEGAFGRVLRVQNVKTGRVEALKVIKNEAAKRKAAMAEIIALTMIDCRDPSNTSFCIKMLNWFSYAGHVCIAFPLLGLSVFNCLEGNDFVPFSIDEVRHISYQLYSATLFLHKNGMTHTDLKPENMLLVNSSYMTVFDEKKKSAVRRLLSTEIRLSDFGSVTKDSDYHQSVATTCYYRAPEIIFRLGWTHSCDIWSIGCILTELYVGELLFPTEQEREHLGMMEKILGEFPAKMVDESRTSHFKNGKLDWNWDEAEKDAVEHCRLLSKFRLADGEDDNQLFKLIEQMLEYDPNHRISSSAVLSQPFFEKISSKERVNAKNSQ